MPITVLSGFLGAGKTSFLQHTLSGRQGTTFGLVVNDMATVNVDAKQIRRQSLSSEDGIDTMELQDGCVCCTLAEDLIASVSKLVSMSDLKNTRYDHIVVECSGIAEPRKIRDLFQQAEDYGFELLKKIRLDTLITAVDATVFLDLFGTDEDIGGNRRLAHKEESTPPGVTYLDGSEQRKVTDLLLEQVECSDIVLINKCDLLRDPSDIELVKKIISCINPSAQIFSCVRGEVVNPLSLIGSAGGQGAANWGVLDEHRKLVKAAELKHNDCHDEDCKDPTHHHEHSHSHSAEAECGVVDCKDPTHHHEHSHSHSAEAECGVVECKDPTHHHEHSHSHSAEAECGVVDCKDPTHDHDHSHSHSSTVTTAEERFGITSFVYKRRRPFHPIRFSMFLQGLGKLSVKGVAELSLVHAASDKSKAQLVGKSASLVRAQRALIRSKGFVWMATSGAAAYFMSHAGQYLELLVLGRWWADINRAEWPAALEGEIAVDFDPVGSHGDRRQELVFIGQFGKDQSNSQQALQEVLDSCLLTDEEMSAYELVSKDGDDALRQHFVPDFQA